MRVLVTGGAGRLATALRETLDAVYLTREELDVTNAERCKWVIGEVKPDIVLHCAAETYHHADEASYEATNVRGTVNVLRGSRKVGARFVYFSTDYVYPGQFGLYRETDPTQPVNGYATSKLSGEQVTQTYADSLVIRGSWYDKVDAERAATDAYTSAVPVRVAAPWITALSLSTATGIVNIGGMTRSRYEIALETNPAVNPCFRRELKLRYPLPANCSVHTERMRCLLGL